MTIETTQKDHITILHLSCELFGGPEGMQLNEEVNNLLDAGQRQLIVDFQNVERMNSSGLGILINTIHTFQQNGGKLKLARLNKRLQQLIQITQLGTLFDVYDSLDSALAAF